MQSETRPEATSAPAEPEASGCLKPLLRQIMFFTIAGGLGFLLLGPKGIVYGMGAHFAGLSGRLFLRIFGQGQRS